MQRSDKAASIVAEGATTEGLPVAPGLGDALDQIHVSARPSLMDRRADPLISAAAANISGHGFIDILVARIFVFRQQHGSGAEPASDHRFRRRAGEDEGEQR